VGKLRHHGTNGKNDGKWWESLWIWMREFLKPLQKNRRLYKHGRTSGSGGNGNNQHHPLRLSRAARRTGHPFRDSHLYGVSYLSLPELLSSTSPKLGPTSSGLMILILKLGFEYGQVILT